MMKLTLSGLLWLCAFTWMVHAQTYNVFYPPGVGQHTHWAYCVGIDTGQIVYNCPVVLQTAPYLGTNAHYHYNPAAVSSNMRCERPDQCSPQAGRSINGNTTVFGSIRFDILPGATGQAERVAATTSSQSTYLDYVIGYNDIYWSDHPEIWEQVGGNTTNHGSNQYNHWMKSYPAYSLFYCTYEYLSVYPQGKICTNDMSLPFGGVFDINQNWNAPHTFHKKGDTVDVPTTLAAQCPSNYKVPDGNRTAFLNMCIESHNALPESGNCAGSCIESNHIHFRWSVP